MSYQISVNSVCGGGGQNPSRVSLEVLFYIPPTHKTFSIMPLFRLESKNLKSESTTDRQAFYKFEDNFDFLLKKNSHFMNISLFNLYS